MKGTKRFLKYALILLISGSGLWAGKILVDEKNWVAISALATLILALGAFLTIRNSNEREKRRRQEELDKEKHDKEERLLGEIIDWATNVAKCGLETGVFDETIPVSGLAAEQALPELLGSVVDFRVARAGSVYISNIASEIAPELKKSVDNLTEEMKKQIKLLMEYKRKTTPTWPAEQVVMQIAGNNERLYNLATKLIDDAANILKRDLSVR